MRTPTLARWRAFAAARYRPFQAIAIGQACTISYASDALFVPLLLRLGAPPEVVTVVGSIPIAGSVVQAMAPQLLRWLHGDLRRLTLAFAVFEVRGFAHAAIVAAFALGLITAPTAVVLVSATVAIGQTAGALSGANIALWTAVVLREEERRLVGPRMGALTMALSTLLLLPTGALLDVGLRTIGVWAYAGLFVVGGLASALTPYAVSRLPRPGRVMVKGGEAHEEPLPEPFVRFVTASAIASVGQGMIPYLSLYAIHVLHATAGFAVALSAAASAGALVGSMFAGSFLLGGSSSRLFRASLIARAVAALICASSIPGNPIALSTLVVGSALFSGAGNAGVLAANERLYRLAPPDLRVRCQSYFVSRTSLAFAAGAGTCALVLALAEPVGWIAYTALFLGSGICRSTAALRTDVAASWRSPVPPSSETVPSDDETPPAIDGGRVLP
jgi:hypothetical protein